MFPLQDLARKAFFLQGSYKILVRNAFFSTRVVYKYYNFEEQIFVCPGSVFMVQLVVREGRACIRV